VLDRYGHLFPSSEQKLNDQLDARYRAAEDEVADRGKVIDLGR